ncbi:hypothetical protein FDP41_012148 [Naegleria fowleri]|uniref:Uncharacterized protein n=1 Tax=Naegleria fowleri TaxID=5763 RepID=A0A6A5C370_NAEFO|nr:uncharacterized protein FDP41_012148 [Naegleria fowleri]KAF0981491.1 hypothetical protein FDP41_012148 [Naegleria fowleri]
MSNKQQKKSKGPLLLLNPLDYPLSQTAPFYTSLSPLLAATATTTIEGGVAESSSPAASSDRNKVYFLPFNFTNSLQCLSTVKTLSYLVDFVILELEQQFPLLSPEDEEEFYTKLHENLSSSQTTTTIEKSLSQQQEEMSETDSHQIQYDHEIVKKFVAELNETLKRKQTKTSGVDEKAYEKLWNQLTNPSLATVYLTVLLGKLLILEEKALKLKQELTENSENDQYVDDKEITLQEVIESLQLGSQKYDAHNPLLAKRKEVKNRHLVVQVDERISEFVNTYYDLSKPGESTTSTSGSASVTSDVLTNDDLELSDVISSLQDNKCFSFNTSFFSDGDYFSKAQLHERSAIMLSLIFVSSFYKFDFQNASLMSVLQLWKNLRFQCHNDSIGEEICEALCPPVDTLYKYMHVCVDYDVVKESDIALRPSLSFHDPLTCIGAIIYERLKTVVSHLPKYTENVLNDLMTLVISTCSNKSLISESYDSVALKNVFNFMKIFLPQLVISRKSKKLPELMSLLQRFFLEPLPIGGLCHNVLSMCLKEQSNPGILMRERFEKSVQRVVVKGKSIMKRRKVHILFNGFSHYADHLTERVDMSNNFADDDIIQCRANLVLNIFDESANSEVKKMSKELEKLSANAISEYYDEVCAACADENKLLNIAKQMQSFKPTGESYKLVRVQAPKLPDVEVELIVMPEEDELTKLKMEKKIFPRSCYYDKLEMLIENARKEAPQDAESVQIDVAVAGGSGTLHRFVHSLFLAHKNNIFKTKPTVDLRVFLLPLGINNYLSSWLEKYDGWYSRHVFYPLLCKIPVLPHLFSFNRTTADDFFDKRSGRSYASTRKSTLFVPHMKLSKRELVKATEYKPNKKVKTPHKFTRSLLNDYFIDGTVSYPVHIYNTQCLTNEVIIIPSGTQDAQKSKSTKTKEFISLSFCQRLDIGILAEAHLFQRENKIEASSIEEILDNKQFKFTGTPLTVSYVPMDPTGEENRAAEIQEPAKTYNSISIQSCSLFGDRGSLVAPSQPWLEVFIEETGSKKKKKMRDCDVGTNYHVGSVTIESSTFQQFSVLMDGELHGPFHKIIISSSQQTFKLQTFNNVDIY